MRPGKRTVRSVAALKNMATREPSKFVQAAVAILPSKIDMDEDRVVYVISDREISVEEWAEKYCKDEADVKH